MYNYIISIYKLLCFRGRGGFHDTGELSVIDIIFKPLICKPLIA
ncbi:hypothetical protein DOY81_009469, partial [Sarcophaga bullata]